MANAIKRNYHLNFLALSPMGSLYNYGTQGMKR